MADGGYMPIRYGLDGGEDKRGTVQRDQKLLGPGLFTGCDLWLGKLKPTGFGIYERKVVRR